MGRSCAESKMRLLFGKAMCIFAVGVTLFGLSEFIMKNNFLYMSIRQNHYFDTFISRRMMSTQIHPAALGTYFVSVIPVSLGLYLAASTKKIRILRLFIFLIITLGAILTLSRGAFLGGVAGISAILLLTRRQKFLKIFSFIVISLFILFTVISSISKAKGHIDYNHLSIDRISLVGLTNPDDYIKKSGRIESGWRIVKDHPFLGLGPGNYRSYFDYYLPNLENQTPYIGKVADLMYLTIISEIGIFGFLIFSLFIFLTLSRSLRDGSAPFLNKDRITLFSFIGGFIGIMFTFLVYDGLYWFVPGCLFWFYSGIISDSGEA
jgi:O-antigen ligase